jgi:hypothetical protein
MIGSKFYSFFDLVYKKAGTFCERARSGPFTRPNKAHPGHYISEPVEASFVWLGSPWNSPIIRNSIGAAGFFHAR